VFERPVECLKGPLSVKEPIERSSSAILPDLLTWDLLNRLLQPVERSSWAIFSDSSSILGSAEQTAKQSVAAH
jgi:hypothetical protein